MSADRNLLFGMLALQMDFIDRDQLVAGMHAWVLAKHKSLGAILQEQGALSAAHCELLTPLVEAHIQQHDNDPQHSLAAISSVSSMRQELEKVGDAELQQSLSLVGKRPSSAFDPDLTQPPVVTDVRSPGGLRFRILRPHARGGLGEVSIALDTELQREVALKEIQGRHADNADARARFMLEGEITGKLEHPGIVPVYGLGSYSDGRPFYAMRFIKGNSLMEAIKACHGGDSKDRYSSVQFRKLLSRFLDVCNAIAYAHSRGVLHRDLKPDNVMLGKYGETLVVDWGLAKTQAQKDQTSTLLEAPIQLSGASGLAQTEMGRVMGTPAYMSPEQAEGRLDQLGPATDVYSLGATMYALLTGQAPLANEKDILKRVIKGDIPRPRQINAAVPLALEAICRKAMALKPDHRYTNPKTLTEDIEHWLADEPVQAWPEPMTVRARRWTRRHRLLVTAAAAAVVVMFLVGVNAILAHQNGELERTTDNLAQSNIALQDAKKTAEDARAKEMETRELAEHLSYLHGVALADSKWITGDGFRAREVLLACDEKYRNLEWYHLQHLIAPEIATLRGHNGIVLDVAFSPDGLVLASAGGDKNINLWHGQTGQLLGTLLGHEGSVRAVAFSSDGRHLVSGSLDNTVKIWDIPARKLLLNLDAHGSLVIRVAFAPDQKRVFAVTQKKQLLAWNLQDGAEVISTPAHEGEIASAAFRNDCLQHATGFGDGSVAVWESATGNLLASWKAHKDQIIDLAFLPDDKTLATLDRPGAVKFWTASTGAEVVNLPAPGPKLSGMCFSPDGLRVAWAAPMNLAISLANTKTGKEIARLAGHRGMTFHMQFSPDGRRLATASADGTAKLWDAPSSPNLGKATARLANHSKQINHIAYSPDGLLLASASLDNSIKLWDTVTGMEIRTLMGHRGNVLRIAFSPDGSRLASAHWDNDVKIWDVQTGMDLWTLQGHKAPVFDVAFSPDGRLIASASIDQTVKLWTAGTGTLIDTLSGSARLFPRVAFSPDGSYLCSPSPEGDVKVWNAATRTIAAVLHGHTKSVLHAVFSNNSQQLVSASMDGTVRLWDVGSGKQIATLARHSHTVHFAAFSPDGRFVASAGGDGWIKIWDVERLKEVHVLEGHSDSVLHVAYSPDGERLASAGRDGLVRLWDAGVGREVATLRGPSRQVLRVEFSPQKMFQLASAGNDDPAVMLWYGKLKAGMWEKRKSEVWRLLEPNQFK